MEVSKFKVGDKVKIAENSLWLQGKEDKANPKNVEGVITRIESWDYIIVKWPEEEYPNCYATNDLVYSKTPHKHAELIKQWIEDTSLVIQFKDDYGQFIDHKYGPVQWLEGTEYRIKPEPKPDISTSLLLVTHPNEFGEGYSAVWFAGDKANVKCVFDGETRKLKSVELI